MSEHSPPFTPDELDIARQTDLPDLFASLGYQVKPKGNYHTLTDMPHIMIKRRSSYYDNYTRAWGDATTFLQAHHNMDFKQAVHYLLEYNGHKHKQSKLTPPRVSPPPQEVKSPAEFILPDVHINHRRVFAYLIKRGISRNVIADFIRNGLLYESADYHNAVFVGVNAKGKAVNAYMRGTYNQNGNGFKGDVPGGDKNNAFRLPTDSVNDTVFCFEGPIDLMAYISLHGEPETNAVALCSLHDGTLEQYLKENPHIKSITFCLDSDKWGREATERLSAKYSERGYTISALFPPKGKDWAEYAAKKKMCQSKGR
jgi:hypothetical protein